MYVQYDTSVDYCMLGTVQSQALDICTYTVTWKHTIIDIYNLEENILN